LLEDAAAGQPGNATYQYHLGLTYLKMNETARGKAALQKALAIDPQGPYSQQIREQLK